MLKIAQEHLPLVVGGVPLTTAYTDPRIYERGAVVPDFDSAKKLGQEALSALVATADTPLTSRLHFVRPPAELLALARQTIQGNGLSEQDKVDLQGQYGLTYVGYVKNRPSQRTTTVADRESGKRPGIHVDDCYRYPWEDRLTKSPLRMCIGITEQSENDPQAHHRCILVMPTDIAEIVADNNLAQGTAALKPPTEHFRAYIQNHPKAELLIVEQPNEVAYVLNAEAHGHDATTVFTSQNTYGFFLDGPAEVFADFEPFKTRGPK